MSLTLKALAAANKARDEEVWRALDPENIGGYWRRDEWMTALSSEVGELAQLLKRGRRQGNPTNQEIGDEMADILTYLDLLAQHLHVDLTAALVRKWNLVSERVGCRWHLRDDGKLVEMDR